MIGDIDITMWIQFIALLLLVQTAPMVFVVVGLYASIGRFWVKQVREGRTYFALTDRRAIALERKRKDRCKALFLDEVPVTKKHVDCRGIGTIRFGKRSLLPNIYMNTGLELGNPAFDVSRRIYFFDIEDADRVFELATQSSARRAAT